MKHFAILGAVGAIGLSALAGQAQADIYIFTHSGTVQSGIDIYGDFGRSGADLSGKAYTLSFLFDADSLSLDPYSTAGFTLNTYYADKSLVKLTINGKDHYAEPFSFTYGVAVADPPFVSSRTYALGISVKTPGETVVFQVASETPFMGASDLAPFQYSPTNIDLANPLATERYWNGYDYKFVFNTTEISLTSQAGELPAIPTAGVPEPASWALMIMGFGLAGAAARRRRALAAI